MQEDDLLDYERDLNSIYEPFPILLAVHKNKYPLEDSSTGRLALGDEALRRNDSFSSEFRLPTGF